MTGPNDRILPPGGLGPKQQPIYIGVDLSSKPDQTAAQIVLTREALASLPEVQALIREAVEAEREACAQDADFYADQDYCAMGYPEDGGIAASGTAHMIAAAIRKRGEG